MADDDDLEALDGVGIPSGNQKLSDCIKVYKGCNVNYPYYLSLPDLERFQATAKDVAICGFPKSGSAWLSAIVTMIQANGDPKSLLQGPALDEKVPYLEFCTPLNYAGHRVVDQLNQQPGGRTFFTHLSYDALPPSIAKNHTKIIYHIRNPKDVIVSTYFHLRSRRQSKFSGNLDVMVDAFVQGTVCYGPYFDHLASYWKHRADPDVFILSFEQLSKDFTGHVRKLASFLGKSLTDEQCGVITHYCSFEQMKENERTNRVASDRAGVLDFRVSPFLRAGSVGNWKVYFSNEMDAKVDAWLEKDLKREDLAGLSLIFE